MFFTFPEDARWNAEQQAVEFGVEIGEYHGAVRVPRRVFQRLLADSRWRRARTACRGCSSACTSSSASGLTSSGPTCAVIDAAGGLWRRSQVRTGLAAGGEWIRTSSSADAVTSVRTLPRGLDARFGMTTCRKAWSSSKAVSK
jgi:hypothetical protein